MNFLKQLKESQAVHESLLPILFGEKLEDEDYWYDIGYDIPRLSQNVLLFYFGLMQAYCFARAHSRSIPLDKLDIPAKTLDTIKNVWNVNETNGFKSFSALCSYLKQSANDGYSVFFAPEATDKIKAFFDIIGDVSPSDDKEDNSSKASESNLIEVEPGEFLSLLESLPLLRITRFESKTMKLEFLLSEEVLPVKVSPFISFLSFDNGPIGDPVDTVTPHCYVLVSVSKGEKNNELFFDTIRVDETGKENDDKKKIRRQVQSNENLMLLCKTANIETQWYSADDCWCDLNFLNKMVDATEKVLLEYCGISQKKYHMDQNIRDEMLHILMDTDLYPILETKVSILVKDLNDILFDLFLSEGLFKTVQCILINPPSISENDVSSRTMFNFYMSTLSDAGHITEQQCESIIAECDNKINIALEKLSHIVPVGSAVYKKREMEIRAEWKTFYILQAAGIRANNLFADVETILSIDDFYDMIGNDYSSLEFDLMQVLRMLCVFYAALLENKVPFDEDKFYVDAKRIVEDYDLSAHTLSSLFDSFSAIAKKAETSTVLETLIGRKGLGKDTVDYVDYCRKIIMSPGKHHTKLFPKSSTGFGIFISYAHEDYNIVKPIVERWKKKGISFFFDDKDIDYGDNWQEMVENAIDSPECKLVVAFLSENSVVKNAVAEEINHAYRYSKEKYPDDEKKQKRFILPVNLEIKDTEDYLDTLAETASTESKRGRMSPRRAAKIIRSCISTKDSFLRYNPNDVEYFDSEVQRVYGEMSGGDGSVVLPTQELDGIAVAVANFYSFLKFGDTSYRSEYKNIDAFFNSDGKESRGNKGGVDFSKCIFPIVVSVKESRIKRDHIAIVGYELIRGKGRKKAQISQILSSRNLAIDDYYCIPKYRNSDEFRNWMVEPLLIRCNKFIEILNKTKENDNV